MITRGNIQRADESRRKMFDIAAQLPIYPVSMVFDPIFRFTAVGFTLPAAIKPGKCRFDAVRRVVGERQRNSAGRRYGQQMRVTQASPTGMLI